MIIAEISTFPIGEGASVSRYVKAAVKALEGSGVRTVPGPMGTAIEAVDMDSLLAAVKAAHEAVAGAGAKRIYTTLKIDDRRDKPLTLEGKLESIGKGPDPVLV